MGSTQSSSIQPYIDGSFSAQMARDQHAAVEKYNQRGQYLGGYLSTMEGKIKLQKTHFYFVYDGRLYRKRKETHAFESSSIVCDLRICDIAVCADKRANFRITTPAGHYFTFSAPDAHDAGRWVATLADQAEQSLLNQGISAVPERVKHVMRDNPECADCGHSSPDWVSLNLGVLLCVECAFIHHTLGPHISIPKCLVTSTECWTEPALQVIRDVGNDSSNALWEYLASPRTKPTPTASHEIKEQWIYAKYVCHHFIDRYLTRNLSDDPSKFVFKAAARGDNLEIMRGVAGGGNVRWRLHTDGSSALHAAAQEGHAATCQLLVNLSADPCVTNALQQTPLDVAAGEPTSELLAALLQRASGSRGGRGARGAGHAVHASSGSAAAAAAAAAGDLRDVEAKHQAP